MKNTRQQFAFHPNNRGREKDMMQDELKILKFAQQKPSSFDYQDLENTSNKVQRTSYTYFGLRIGSKLIRDISVHVLKDWFQHLEFNDKKKYYIFAVNRKQDFIASALVKNHGEKQATQIISKQWGGAGVSEGDGLQQSPLGDDLQLSPQETPASPLRPPPRSFRPNPSLKQSLRTIMRVQKSRIRKCRRMIKSWNHKKKPKTQV
ncbi:MAG: hypothetical protein EZS28_042392 [Streblomastix strix]|uniref:Uncharacterized protein n=1 Tax=Streblomastix strix TaxID=222440 RepID=A0A5J4TVM2_9EUKA|nr:MAG: hypothetical protein EZS28_042392 [Streblomastix strix]